MSTVRTSESHPITLSWILEHGGGGKLGLCFCPGKKVNRSGVQWERDLEVDLHRLKEAYRIKTVACLLNTAELSCFRLRHYTATVASSGLDLLVFPIVEMAPPDSVALTREFVQSLVDKLGKGENVAVHCRGGVGRAGVIAACVLLELGLAKSGRGAIEQVRKLRCRQAIESHRQEKFVFQFAKSIRFPRVAVPGVLECKVCSKEKGVTNDERLEPFGLEGERHPAAAPRGHVTA